MGFSATDFDKLYDYCGKDFFEKEFKGFENIPKINLGGNVFDLGIKISAEKSLYKPKILTGKIIDYKFKLNHCYGSCETCKEYSKDDATKNAGGALGFINLNQLGDNYDELVNAANKLKKNEQ